MNIQSQTSKRIFFCPKSEKYLDAETEHFQLPSMKDSSLTRNYLYNKKNDVIFEITKLQNDGSYFSGDYVVADGNIYVINNVNILFLALPYLTKKRGKVDAETKGKMYEINQMFSSEDCKTESERKGLTILRQSPKLRQSLKQICDVSERKIDEEVFFMIRLNDEKLHSWLDTRVPNIVLFADFLFKFYSQFERVKEVVKTRLSSKFNAAEDNENSLNLLAMEFLYEYVADYLLESYTTKYNITVKMITEKKTEKRKYTEVAQPTSNENDPPITNSIQEKSTPTISSKATPNTNIAKKMKPNENLVKAAKNTMNISSFFKKPTAS